MMMMTTTTTTTADFTTDDDGQEPRRRQQQPISSITRRLAVHYVRNRLRRHGLGVESTPEEPDGAEGSTSSEEKIWRALVCLGEEMEVGHAEVFKGILEETLRITPSNLTTTLLAVVRSMFDDGLFNWGRIVALFAFCGCLAVHCAERQMEMPVDQLVNWMTLYIEGHLIHWVNQNGGWNGLVDFYETRNRNADPLWPNCFRNLFGHVVSALGMVTLSAVLSHK